MSPTRQEIRAQRSAAAEARRQAEAKEADREVETTETAAPAVPAPAGEVDPSPPAAVPEPYRPQPFTPDLIPEPVEMDAEGDLTPQEVDDLGHCEAAFANSNRAEWMKWKAAHAVRARRLHRQGGRTWPEYCEDRFGESESEVNRRIQQWPLLKAITEQQDRPRSIPDSHVQRMLPMVKQHGQEVTARAYVALRVWAAERRHRVTADVIDGLVELARGAEPPALTTANTFQRAIEAKPKPKRARKQATALVEAGAAPADTQEDSGPETSSHPNLGDSGNGAPAGEADADESVVDAEIVEDENLPHQAGQTRDVLQGMLAAIEAGRLRDAPTETLKEISTAALSIAYAVDEVLKNR
ncbi:hypothetical protein SHJG_p234 (plasmid) [Streptomyces hygroscopicus subsp. jinggangensis 5008]|nr:hypothetical protein SHJG_p234 [Streptomyces hygroscopicus subsp. jinggangensis 5008]AGF68503.1 hypothetical protein SHJGH_p234 [Streptomyces hygroscopicus subsp. jinggangensis TL01]